MGPTSRYWVTRETPPALRLYAEAVEANLDRSLTVADFEQITGYSESHLSRLIKVHIDPDMTVIEYHCHRRLQCARIDLVNANRSELQVQEVAARYGFTDHSHFSFRYRRLFGEAPSDTLNT